MPPRSRAQQRLAGADLARARAGTPTRTDMTIKQLEDFATVPKGKQLPARAPKPKAGTGRSS